MAPAVLEHPEARTKRRNLLNSKNRKLSFRELPFSAIE